MAVSNLVGKGAKKSVRIRTWLRITALLMAVWVVCAAAVAEGAALPEESASVQAEASDGQPAQAPQEGAPPEGERPPEPPGGEGEPGSLPPQGPDGQPPQAPGDLPSAPGTVSQGTAATTLETDTTISGGSFLSQKADENALRVTNTAQAALTGVTIQKLQGDTSSTENSDFYGQNAGFLATDGAQAALTAVSVTTAATGGNAVVSYGEGTAVSVTDSTVSTTGDHSGGIHVTGGGELTAWNVDVETQGNSSAAIRSDRGGGTLTVEDGSYVTNGTGSPAIYSTAQIAVTNAVLTANRSEAIVVEGRNSVTLTDCTVSGNMQGTYGPDSGENLHGVMLYQSMSGDAQEGQSLFRMTGGELTTLSRDLFYVTNTDCAIELSGVALTLADGCLLRVEGNTGERGWGTPGENGGRCTLNAIAQALSGTIRVDESSSLDMTLSDGATFEGTVNPEGQGGEVNVTLAQGCRWTLTADAYVTSFTGDLSCVETNGYTLYTAQEKPVAGV